ncbi:hypothetical protein KIN20_010778 [Parelaphostrongylus tenuis]|uniref:Uncharacterized protein n=1 Tax=Parelaphostrongylus tenuis TaxID=148309 RepID=A0AAD5MU05_PARTN|nr:hypothetical protein KIN20_010778 [Parelaphostrongylus tenuis]
MEESLKNSILYRKRILRDISPLFFPQRQIWLKQSRWSTTLESKWYRRGSRTLDRNGPSGEGGTELPLTSTVSLITEHHPNGRLTSSGPLHLKS